MVLPKMAVLPKPAALLKLAMLPVLQLPDLQLPDLPLLMRMSN